MIRRLLVWALGAAGVVYGDSASPSALTVTFNGAALEIHTESTMRTHMIVEWVNHASGMPGIRKALRT